MNTYTAFATVYDEFMDNVDYDAWGGFIIKKLKENGINEGLVLDLGCGTGKITRYLAASGYDMTGIDASERMLQIASGHRVKAANDILYLCQDMREFELYGTMRAIISTCDSINYILEEKELKKVFGLVHNYLDPDGIFIFDFSTEYKYLSIGDACIAENRENGSFIWENFYDETELINEYRLTLFIPEKSGLYRKYEELHIQRAYTREMMQRLLLEAGFEILSINNGYSDEKPRKDSERILITALCVKTV